MASLRWSKTPATESRRKAPVTEGSLLVGGTLAGGGCKETRKEPFARVLLEPLTSKDVRAVLRGLGGSNPTRLPDSDCWRIQAATASRAKCDWYVPDFGSPLSHASARLRLIAAAVATC